MAQTNSTTARKLASLSSDCSFLVSHLVRQNGGNNDARAKKILELILNFDESRPGPLLKASKVGWFATATPDVFNPITSKFDAASNHEAVCFTESTLAGLRAHRDVFAVKYGLAFDRDWIFAKGGNPCLNVAERLLRAKVLRNGEKYGRHLYNFIPPALHPFVNIIHDGFDATHEREWRVAGDLGFAYENILFVFCPETEFKTFARVQTNGRPVLFDLAWLDRI